MGAARKRWVVREGKTLSLMSLPRLLVLFALLFVFLAPQTGALADEWDDCESKQADQIIRGCTAIINARNEDNEGMSDAYFFRGTAYSEKKDYNSAISDFTQSIALNPNDANAYFARGWNYQKRGDLNGAIADYNQAIKLDPSQPNAVKNRDEALRLKGASIPTTSPAPALTPSCPAGYVFSQGRCVLTPAPTPAYPSAPPGCPPAWVLPNGGCAGTVTPTPAPAPPVRRAAPVPGCPPAWVLPNGGCAGTPTPSQAPAYSAPPVRRAAPIRRAAPPIRRAAPPIRRAAREGDLEYDLQEELKYIGCYTGSLDGIWGPRSQSALNRFIDLVGTSYARKPSQYVLDAVRNEKKGFCKPVRVAPKRKKAKGCRSGTVFLEGQCIRRSEVASFCGPGFERSGSKCVSMGDASSCLNKCERRLTTCRGNINEDEDEVICMNKFDSCNQSC